MIEGTFCDWLINQGVRFHPDTVIVEMTAIPQYYDTGLHNMDWHPIGTQAIPPFDYMFFEWVRFSGKNKLAYGFYCVHKKEPIHDEQGNKLHNWGATVRGMSFVKFNAWGKDYIQAAEDPFYYEINQHGICDTYLQDGSPFITNGYSMYSEDMHITFEGINIFDTEYAEGIDYDSQSRYYAHVAIHGIELLHQRCEIELVDYSPSQIRIIKKREGKEPSPYFRIITPGQPQKRYDPNGQRPTQIKNMPLHSVRGHFRHTDNHPIEHFNGTFWIPAHTRGDEKLGKLVKHYKIRLPED